MELKTIQEMCRRSEGVMGSVFEESRADTKFYWGDQWDGQEGARRAAGRQSVVFNNCPSLVHPVVNAVKQAPPAIRILPLGGGATQEKAARVAARIRMIERECKASKARLYALTCAAIGGIGVWRSIPKKVRGKWTTWSETIIDPTDVLPDASSMEPDFSDARWVLHKRKVHKSRLAMAYNASELATQYEFHREDSAYSDELVQVIECWYLDKEGTLCRCVATDTEVLGFQEGEGEVQTVEKFDGLTELPYNFVIGDFYQDEAGVRHYSSLTRYAKADQIAINYSENEWISDIVMTPKIQFLAEADAVEDYEEEAATAHVKVRPYLKVKSLDKIRDFAPPDKSGRFMAFSQSHRQSMTAVTGVAPTQGQVMDPVSGKSVKLQQSQAAVSTYHYIDSLNAAIEHDGRVYLDQMRVYENDDTVRASLGEDGTTITQVSFGPGQVEGAENIDLEGSEFGVAVSTGPSYGSQLEQVQDMVTELCARVPALAPILLPLVVRRMAIPESEDVIQALTLSLPPNIQAMLAQKGDKGAQLAQAMSQAQQAGQMVQQLQGQLQQAMNALQQTQQALESKETLQERDNATKRHIAEVQERNKIILKRMELDGTLRNDLALQNAKTQDAQEMALQNAGHAIVTGFAGRVGMPAPASPFDHL